MFAAADRYVPQCTPGALSLKGPLLVWAIVAVGALAFLSLVFAAPLALAQEHQSLANFIYSLFSHVCHQMPERSFHVAGYKLAVCARCTGIYAGFAVGAIIYPLLRSLRRTDTPARLWLFVAALPISIDWTLGVLGIWQNTHLSRLLTGAFFGAVCAFFVVPGLIDFSRIIRHRLSKQEGEESPRSQVLPHGPERTVLSDYSAPARRI